MPAKKKKPALGAKRRALIAEAKQATTRLYTPAEWAIKQFGSPRALAAALDYCPATVYRWLQPPDERSRGANGRVPGSSIMAVLDAARKLGLDVTATDLVEGRRA